jgi:hypothetical protein
VTAATLTRYQPLVVRALRDVLSVAGVVLLVITLRNDGPGYDFYAYWSVDPANPYAVKEGFGAFHYAPPFVWLVGPLKLLPWPTAYWIWLGALLLVLVWVARDWALAWLAFPPVASELFHGNIHLLIAAALVISLRRPAAYVFLALTKVTPAVSGLWWLVRREWRPFLVAVAAAGLVVATAVTLQPGLWVAYVVHISSEANHAPNLIPIPVLIRLPAAAALVIVAGRLNRRVLLAPAVVLALPLLWIHGLAVLVAMTPLYRLDRAARPSSAPAPVFSIRTLLANGA